MRDFIKLPNGDWVRPSYIIAIRKEDACVTKMCSGFPDVQHKPRLCIDIGEKAMSREAAARNCIVIESETNELRDQMAEQIMQQIQQATE